jgi:hypothetical protein
VNESSQCIATHDSDQPQDQENYKDCPEHVLTSEAFPRLSTFNANPFDAAPAPEVVSDENRGKAQTTHQLREASKGSIRR